MLNSIRKRRPLRRRAFLRMAGAAAVAGSAVSCGGQRTPWRFFTVPEAALVAAICDQVIPVDRDPGAVWAGAVRYIDRQLMGPFRKLQPQYRCGLAALDRACLASTKRRFLELPFDRQTAFLEGLRGGHKRFFMTVVDHTMQSYYGDPRHGGNRNGVSRKMIGVPLIPVRGRRNKAWTGQAETI